MTAKVLAPRFREPPTGFCAIQGLSPDVLNIGRHRELPGRKTQMSLSAYRSAWSGFGSLCTGVGRTGCACRVTLLWRSLVCRAQGKHGRWVRRTSATSHPIRFPAEALRQKIDEGPYFWRQKFAIRINRGHRVFACVPFGKHTNQCLLAQGNCN
jgi:hypothetical protein